MRVFIAQITMTILTAIVFAAPAFAQDVVPGEFIVKMKGKPSQVRAHQFLGKVGSRAHLKATFGKLNMHHVALEKGQNEKAFVDEMKNDPDVEYIEPNYILHKFDGETAGADARAYSIDEVREMNATYSCGTGQYCQSQANTNMVKAWNSMSASSSDVPVVAIVDTGIDYNHTVFTQSGALWRNPGEIPSNGIDDDGNGYIDDVFGWNFHDHNNLPYDDDEHGTHVAGIVLGATQDIFATTLAPAKIRIMPLKFLGADGSGSTSDAVQAIYYAVNNGASIINNSWGGSSYSQSLHDALAFAYQNHLVIVNAAGNYGTNNDTSPLYPASYPVPSSIAVAATTDQDNIASFSNYGKDSVRVAAPGVYILSTIPGNNFTYMSGTSMAAPFVSGLAALALREAPNLTGYQVANLVVNSGANISVLMNLIESGNRGDGYQTVAQAKAQVNSSPDQPVYVASNSRAPASDPKAGVGCGSVAWLGKELIRPNNPPPQTVVILLMLSLMPLLIWQALRRRALDGANRRRHERFVMNSEIRVKIGERELVGQMNTISLGGLSFKADAMLEKGGVVTLQIAGPDGGEQVQVEGRIVWNEKNQAFGVQFEGARESALSRISGWTSSLRRTPT